MLKGLRKVIADKDPLTVQWLAADEEPRLEFLLHEYLPSACKNTKTDHEFERIRQELGGFDEWIEEDEAR